MYEANSTNISKKRNSKITSLINEKKIQQKKTYMETFENNKIQKINKIHEKKSKENKTLF